MAAALDADLQSAGQYCTHCLRSVDAATAVIPSSDRFNSVFCSKDCETKCKCQYHNLLFGMEPVVPPEMSPLSMIPGAQEARNAAQSEYATYLKSITKTGPLLAARFAGRQGVLGCTLSRRNTNDKHLQLTWKSISLSLKKRESDESLTNSQ